MGTHTLCAFAMYVVDDDDEGGDASEVAEGGVGLHEGLVALLTVVPVAKKHKT